MKQLNEKNFVGTIFGIILGIILNAYLIFDISYYGIMNKHSPLDFIWKLSISMAESNILLLPTIFLIFQMVLTTLYCILISPYLVPKGKIIPPFFVLLGATVPLLLILWQFLFQSFQSAQATNAMYGTYLITFLTTFFYVLVVFIFGGILDQIVKKMIGAYSEEEEIEKRVGVYSSSLGFESLLERIENPKWLRDYSSLTTTETSKDEGKGEALFRFNKIGTNYYLCTSIFQRNKHNFVLFTFYELFEDRFGREQRVNEGVEKALTPQIDLIKEQLSLSDAKAENGILKKALRFTTQVGKTTWEKITPYRLQANLLVFNIIILVILLYAYSSQITKAEVAIAIYALVLTLSLEIFRLRRK